MRIKSFLVVAVLAGMASTTFGQGMPGLRQKDPGEQLAKLFGKTSAFSATAAITFKKSAGRELPAMQITYAMLDGKVRTDIDLAKMGGEMPADGLAQMKQLGMDRMAHIYLPATKASYMVYPGLKSYCELSSPAVAGGPAGAEPKIEKTDLGKETVEGHACNKAKLIITDEQGRKVEALVWHATDLKDFPIKSEMTTDDGAVVTTVFSNINQSKPDAALFALPSDYTRYGSMQELMMGNMGRLMPGGVPHGARGE